MMAETANREAASLGKYQPFAKLGSGGQADVYLAVARGPMGFNKLVVVKRLKSEVVEHPELLTMFLDEARLAARLNHPNVVQTFEVGETGGAYFIAMEYLDGQPLYKLMRLSTDVMSPAMWAHVVAEALSGLHHAHELCDYDGKPLNIVHRDVSPQNIFLAYEGEVKIVDFGIAKATLNNARTQTGVVKGKASYMAPEQAYGAQLDRRVDIFAMGIVLWEALTGRRLFDGEPLAIMHRLVSEEVPRASSVVPSIDPALDAIVARSLEKDPDKRYQTADEMRDALEGYIAQTGKIVRKADIGKVVATTFAGVREKVHAQIQTYMISTEGVTSEAAIEMMSKGPPSLPEIGQPGTPSHVKLRLPALGLVAKDDAAADASLPDTADGRTNAAPPPSSLTTWLPIAALCIAVIGAIAALRRPRPEVPIAPVATALIAPPPERTTTPVRLTSEPSDALVEWNGAEMGRTPLTVELPAGPQTLVASRPGYVREVVVVNVVGGAAPIDRAVVLRAMPVVDGASAASGSPAPPAKGRGAPQAGRGAIPAPPPAVSSPVAPVAPATETGSKHPVRPIDEDNPFQKK
jgi:serine/threonine-protein kinase